MSEFGDKLRHVERQDPAFAKAIRRARFAIGLLTVAVFMAIGVGAWLVIQNSEQDEQLRILRPQVTEIVKVAGLCIPPIAQNRKRCARRFRAKLINCARFDFCQEAILVVEGLAPFPSSSSPSTSRSPESISRDKDQNTPPQPDRSSPQQPKPDKQEPNRQKSTEPSQPVTPPSATPQTSGVEPPADEQDEPGKSGESSGDSKDKGVKTCVDLIVSACVGLGK